MKPRYFLSKILSKCSNHHLIKAIMNNLTTQRNPEILFLIKIVYDHTYNFLVKTTHLINKLKISSLKINFYRIIFEYYSIKFLTS